MSWIVANKMKNLHFLKLELATEGIAFYNLTFYKLVLWVSLLWGMSWRTQDSFVQM